MISRRNFLNTSIASSIGISLVQPVQANPENETKTRYIAAYDTESPNCLKACEKIVEMHKRHSMPATFFVVGKMLEANPAEYKKLLNDPLFEVASHTYSHRLLKDHPLCGPGITLEQKHEELFKGKEIVEKVFERPCLGFRSGCGFDNGLKGSKDVLALVKGSGFLYASTLLWGPDYSLPALLNDPFNYSEDGFSDIWELPGHGWHENILKNNNKWGAKRVTLWPPAIPEAIPNDFVKTPEEEFAVHRVFLEKALKENKKHVSLIWHPWSLHSFDPEMKMLDLMFTHVKKLGLKRSTYADLYAEVTKM